MTSRDAEPTTRDDALSRETSDNSRDDADTLSRDDALDRRDATTDDLTTRSDGASTTDDTMSGTSTTDGSGTPMTDDTSGTSRADDTTSGTSRSDESTATTTGADDPEQLVPQDQVLDLQARWEVIQQGFVDDPRSAVSDADSLVDELLEKLSKTFDEQQHSLESQWSDGEPSTEDLRSALQRYRAFFNRLLTI